MKNFVNFLLHIADSSLIMGHRLSEYTGHAPELEIDIALSNIALDLVGQSRNTYQLVANLCNENNIVVNQHNLPKNISEDSLAYWRDVPDYKNFLLVELPNENFGNTILKIFYFSNQQLLLLNKLNNCNNSALASIAQKSVKEAKYHVSWSKEWVLRLGLGTDVSNNIINEANENLWAYTGEFFEPTNYDDELLTEDVLNFNFQELKNEWLTNVTNHLSKANIKLPNNSWMQTGGKKGIHTEHLGYILAEMQFLQRTHPGCNW